MDDPELAKLREARLAQLSSQYGGSSDNQKAQDDRARAMEENKHGILAQILDQNARARLNTIKLGKPEKGQMIESMVIQMAQRGQIRGKMNESEFISILESVNQQMPKTAKLNFQRRKDLFDSDED